MQSARCGLGSFPSGTESPIVPQSMEIQESYLLGHRQHTSVRSLKREPGRGVAVHAATLAVVLLGMVGQGFSPCRRHTSLEPSRHGRPTLFTGSILGGMPDGHAAPADSESGHGEAVCSCLNPRNSESEHAFSPGQIQTPSLFFTALYVVEWRETSLRDTRRNEYLTPLPQPPPHSSLRSS